MDGAANFGDADGDWLDIEYSAGGTSASNFVSLNSTPTSAGVGTDYFAETSVEDNWALSSSEVRRVVDDQVIDLSSVGNVKYIRFTIDASDIGSSLYLDNISVTGAVPEPSTYALLAGVIALSFCIVRRKK